MTRRAGDDCQVDYLAAPATQDGWERYIKRYPTTARRYHVIPTLHTSQRGIANGGQQSRDDGIARLEGDSAVLSK